MVNKFNNPLQGMCPRDTLSHVNQKTSSRIFILVFLTTHTHVWDSLAIYQHGLAKLLNIHIIKSVYVNLDYLKNRMLRGKSRLFRDIYNMTSLT